jgi:6-pyruvoyltetrahydropterin/6-carboxytetrahydropterin synthase
MSESPSYRVRVTKDHLVFSAGHFITIETSGGEICERIHGHNWRAAVEVGGPLDRNQYVFDFIALRDTLQAIVLELDHRMLLPDRHPRIKLNVSDAEIEARYQARRWVFPRDECVVLPIAQTTAELIASWMAGRLLAEWGTAAEPLDYVQVEVEENFGQWAIYRTSPGAGN